MADVLRKTYKELAREQNKYNKKYKYLTIHHKKSDSYYVITDIHFRESDMTIWFTYQPIMETVKFSRPIEELTDGRYDGIK